VQETLLAIHLKRHTWRREELVGPWVAAIARNKLVDQIRRRGRRAELPLDDLLADTLEARPDEEPSTSHDLARAMADLNERQRVIVQLVAIEGHSSRDAAQRLGITEGALRVALHRTLRAMAQRLEGQLRR
jgi:RNA polymerase sigma-70 factor (ECF subfamily)